MSDNTSFTKLDAISDWSKWAVGLSLFSATGCVGVLIGKGIANKEQLLRMQLAIVFFLLTVFIAWIVQLLLATLKTGYRGKIMGISVIKWTKLFIISELMIFALSLFFLGLWICNVPLKKPELTGQTMIFLPGMW
jgi:hypothetical protein